MRVWAMVSDLPRMGEWSPETTGGRWKDGATGPAVGAKFVGRNRLGVLRWSTLATVVGCEKPTEFAFDVSSGPFKVSRWAYRISPTDSGCEVTETWEDHRSGWFAKTTGLFMRVKGRSVHNRRTMTETLEALAAAAEASPTDGETAETS